MFQRKKEELLEKTPITPQSRTPFQSLSPEPVHNFKNELSKSVSSTHIKKVTKDILTFNYSNSQEYCASKNQNGMNCGPNANDQSSSSASGISSPSNTSNTSNREDEEKYVDKEIVSNFYM